MTTETLSDEIITTPGNVDEGRIQVEAVKQFIKDLKEMLTDGSYYGDNSFTQLFKEIDELAGEKLI